MQIHLPTQRNFWNAAALGLLLACLPGCVGTALPNWLNPGPTKYQINQAESYDPYPDPTIGPPVVGGRPLGYLDPRANPDPAKIKPPFAGSAYPAGAVTYPPPPVAGPPVYGPVYGPPAACAAPPVAAPMANAALAPRVASPSPAIAAMPSAPVAWQGTTTGAPMNATVTGASAPVAYGKALGTP